MKKEKMGFLCLMSVMLLMGLLGQYFGVFQLSEHYHNFADERGIFGLSRFMDTFSNVAFLYVGFIFIKEILLQDKRDKNLILVAMGTFLVCFGSGYYHLSPDNHRLLWDRLPMAMVFSGILMYSVQYVNLVNEKYKNYWTIGYFVFSIISVLVWYIGSLQNESWLGLYVVVQFGGMLGLTYVALFGKNKEMTQRIIGVLIWYICAKLCEHYDQIIFEITKEFISGHTIKHLLSAIALYVWFPKELRERVITRKSLKLNMSFN